MRDPKIEKLRKTDQHKHGDPQAAVLAQNVVGRAAHVHKALVQLGLGVFFTTHHIRHFRSEHERWEIEKVMKRIDE